MSALLHAIAENLLDLHERHATDEDAQAELARYQEMLNDPEKLAELERQIADAGKTQDFREFKSSR